MHTVGREVGSQDAGGRGEDDQTGHDGEHAHDLGQDEVTGGVDAHDLQGVDLLGDAHRAQLGGDVRPYLACQDETHDGRGELEQQDLSCDIAADPPGHPGALDVELHLDADDGSDEERDEQYDADGVDTQLRHLLNIRLEEHTHALWHGEHAPHEHQVAAENGQIFECYHMASVFTSPRRHNTIGISLDPRSFSWIGCVWDLWEYTSTHREPFLASL